MRTQSQNNTIKNIFHTLAGLIGISTIILIHEAGHFLFAKFFNVSASVFSLGFGPTLYSFSIANTVFKLALFPIGGYVDIVPEELAQQSYLPKMLILFGGILFNIIFAYAILLYYIIRRQISPGSALSSSEAMRQSIATLFAQQNSNGSIIGPIGIIHLIGKSIAINPQLYWFVLAILSLNVGLLNILPLPFLDGGKMLLCTVEAILGTTISPTFIWLISSIFLMLFVLFITQITMNDIKKLIKNN